MAYVYVQPFPFAFGGHFGSSAAGCCRASAYAGSTSECGRRSSCRGRREQAFTGFGKAQSVETETSYIIFVSAQGLQREDLTLAAEDGDLVLTAKQDGEVVFKREWSLPSDVFADAVSAKLDRGELTITLPKKPKLDFEVPVEGGEPIDEDMATEPEAAAVDKAGPSAAHEDDANEPAKDEADGSWVDVADEEKVAADAKGKAPMDAAVLMEVERQAADDQAKADTKDDE